MEENESTAGTIEFSSLSTDETFLTLYKELYFRHIYAKHKVHAL